MDPTRARSTIERAFELARSGEMKDLAQIEVQLSREGYSNARGQLVGAASLRKQLLAAIRAAKSPQG